MSVNKSVYEKFIIESADQERTADISSGVLAFTYFENIFSPHITARVIVTNTGGSIKVSVEDSEGNVFYKEFSSEQTLSKK